MNLAGSLRRLADGLFFAAGAHARWEIEVADRVFRSRKRLLVLSGLLLAAVMPMLVAPAFGESLPQILGGKRAYAPLEFTPTVLCVSIAIGLAAGLITGCIGAGGGFVITPALMSVGVKGIMAVGTDMFHIFAKAIMGASLHKKMGNVSMKLAACFVAGSVVGVSIAAAINRALYARSTALSDAFINIVYVVFLGFLGFYALVDFFRWRARSGRGAPAGPPGDRGGDLPKLAAAAQSLRMFPMVRFDEHVVPGGKRIWAGLVVLTGFAVGFLAAIMGVGGGFLTFPMFVYGLGVAEKTAVGTDVFQIVFTAGYGGILEYAVRGYVFYTLAMGLLIGSLVGIQMGAFAAKVVSPAYIRGFYATAILAGFFNTALTLPGKLSSSNILPLPAGLTEALGTAGLVLFAVMIGVFALWVIAKFLSNFRKLSEVPRENS